MSTPAGIISLNEGGGSYDLQLSSCDVSTCNAGHCQVEDGE